MLKLNVVGDVGRIILLGMSRENLKRLFNDEPILFPGEHLALRTVRTVTIVGIRDIGHFLIKVAPELGMEDELKTRLIDKYREQVKIRQLPGWFPWMSGGGIAGGSPVGNVACGLLVKEAADAMEQGAVLESNVGCLGLNQPNDVMLTFFRESLEDLVQGATDVLQARVSPEVLVEIQQYLQRRRRDPR